MDNQGYFQVIYNQKTNSPYADLTGPLALPIRYWFVNA